MDIKNINILEQKHNKVWELANILMRKKKDFLKIIYIAQLKLVLLILKPNHTNQICLRITKEQEV